MRHVTPLIAVAVAGCTTGVGRPGIPDMGTSALELIQQVEVSDSIAREPMLVEHPSGAIFVTGYNGRIPRLWKSTDLGTTWRSVDLGTTADGAVGTSDVSLATARDGTVYLAVMTYDPKVNEGVQIAVGVSRDVGATWQWKTVSRARYDVDDAGAHSCRQPSNRLRLAPVPLIFRSAAK